MPKAPDPRTRMWQDYDAATTRLIRAIPDPTPPLTEDTAKAVVLALRGIGPWAWQELDQRAGYRDLGSWFGLVRSTRDSPVYGPLLLEAIHDDPPRRVRT